MNTKIEVDKELIGKRIANSRNKAGLTQDCLAHKIGISSKHMSQIERGISGCTVGIIIEFAKHLNVSTDYLLLGKEPQNSPLNIELNSVTPLQKRYIEEIIKVFIAYCDDCSQDIQKN